jgi:hypothetical protein
MTPWIPVGDDLRSLHGSDLGGVLAVFYDVGWVFRIHGECEDTVRGKFKQDAA